MAKWVCMGVMIGVVTAISVWSNVTLSPAPAVVEINSPAGAGSEEPSLAVAPDGRVFLTWLEAAAPRGHVLRFSTRGTQGWSMPRTVARGNNWFVNAADFPSLTVMADGSLAAHWLTMISPESEAYNINIAFSRDGGATWGKPVTPHRDGTKRQHGFVSMFPTSGGRLAAIWLDGRKMKDEETGDMSLLYNTIGSDGSIGSEATLDSRTCECCQTSATTTPDGLLVVYRDRSDKEIRDISIVRLINGRWTQPEPLTKDGWEIDGCPINGPAISSSGRSVAVAWFTAANDKPRVSVLMSSDSGKTFGKPVPIDDGNPVGRVDVVSLPSGGAVASWIERTSQGTQVRLRQLGAGGTAAPSVTVSGTAGARSGGFPRIERSGNEVVIAWTDAGEKPRVRTAVLSVQ
jgi:hypothetical protein